MWSLLLPFLSSLPGTLGTFFTQKNANAAATAQAQAALEQAKLQTNLQVELARQTMSMDIAKSQMEKDKVTLSVTGSYFKYFTFIMWFGPFMIGSVFPARSAEIFKNLTTMPEWYVQSCMLIMFTVWGISVSAPIVSNIFSGLGNFLEGKRQFKLDKLSIINRQAFYDELRKVQGSVSKAEVINDEKVFDALDKAASSEDQND